MIPASPCVPTAEEAAAQQAILDAEFAAGLMVPPPAADQLADPDDGPLGDAGAWPRDLAGPGDGPTGGLGTGPRDLAGPAGPQPDVASDAGDMAGEPFPSGVIAHGPDGSGGPGFASGSVLDCLGPGPVLAGALDDACAQGLAGLGDDELAGVILAWRRCESRAVAGLLQAVGELGRRRLAHPDPHAALSVTTTHVGRPAYDGWP